MLQCWTSIPSARISTESIIKELAKMVDGIKGLNKPERKEHFSAETDVQQQDEPAAQV
jgi:hypothetical protein